MTTGLSLLLALAQVGLPPAAAGRIDFVTQVRPILEASCVACHGAQKRSGEYRLDRKELALGEGSSGIALMPGKPDKSPLLLNAARVTDEPMPPDGKGTPLTREQVGVLRAWIEQGASWPDGVVLTTPASAVKLPPAVARKVDFVKDVRPILEARCYGCHGPKTQEGELRLDAKVIALGGGGESGPAINPGHGGDSLLVRLVAGAVPGMPRMPEKGEALTTEQIGILRAWIDQGATWPDGIDPPGVKRRADHWSFKPPVRPPLPAIDMGTLGGSPNPPAMVRVGQSPPLPTRYTHPVLASWLRNPIDRFVLAALQGQGLAPSPEADRATLIRRLTLDLLGLPPTPAEVDAFVSDRHADAYERLVDRLLASPHYGERWGRHWLDAARYADTNGFEKDAARSIWPYRDWVIRALNDDMPFDRFATEQLAGDLLPNATTWQRVATGFLRNSMLNEEGGVDPEQFRVEGIVDRVDAVGKAFLGLTINCAQCHTHKFDPIQHKEYYQFFAFLNSDDENQLEVLSPAQEQQRANILASIAKLEDAALADAGVAERLRRWEGAVAGQAKTGTWTVLEDATIFGAFGIKFEKLADHSFIARGDRYKLGTYVVTAKTKLQGITGFRVELMTDDSLPYGGPGRDKDGVATLTELSVEAAPAGKPDAAEKVPLRRATADFAAHNKEAGKAIDGDNQTGWTTDAGPGRRNRPRRLVVETARPVGGAGGTVLTFTFAQREGDQKTIGRMRISATTAPAPTVDPLPAEARAALAVVPEQRTPEQRRALFDAYRPTDPALQELNEKIDAAYRGWPYGPTTLVVSARPQPRSTHVFRRGDWRKPGPEVHPGTLAALQPFPSGAPRNRLGLARWIMDARNPLTARVIVNRVWAAYFGQGLVPTPEDLGTRADPASHPELLDWLAVQFRESGWRMKDLHRVILTSATYRQSSRVSPGLLAKDPYNRFLGRGARLRVEAEVVHDIALSAAGLLSAKIGGPSVYPAIPDGVLNLSYGQPMKWEVSTGDDRHRRGLYTFWKRAVPYPALSVFDAPNGDFACVRRARSNTPLQALTTLNDQVFVEAAQAMGLRIWKEGGRDDRSRATYGFRLAVGRKPTPAEVTELLRLASKERQHFRGDTARAVLVAAPDPANPPPNLDLHQVAPWTMVARVLLNMDETITKE